MKRKYSKRTEVRSSYDAYKAWYTQYSKNHEMGSKMLSKKAFDKNYQLYKADGIKYNIAKTMAADQRLFSNKQESALRKAIKRADKDIKYKQKNKLTLSIDEEQFIKVRDTFKINTNANSFYELLHLMYPDKAEFDNVFSPKEQAI